MKEVLVYNQTHSASPIVLVSEDWIHDCVSSNTLVAESGYIHGQRSTLSPSQSANSALYTSHAKKGAKRDRGSSDDKVIVLTDRN